MVNFILEKFNSTVQMTVSGELDVDATTITGMHCDGVWEVELADVLATFKFSTDASDITNTSDVDVRYQCNKGSLTAFNPLHANVEHNDANSGAGQEAVATGFDSDKSSIMHDYVRHLAEKLFNTHHGVDLFSNETELITDLSGLGNTVWTSIYTDLSNANNLDNTSANDTSANLCRILLEKVQGDAPSRLLNDISNVTPGSWVSIPFKADDTIQFLVTVQAPDSQDQLTSIGSTIADRVYRVILKIVNTASNTSPDNSA